MGANKREENGEGKKREKRVKEEKRKNRATLRDCGRKRVRKRGTEQRQAEGGRQN